MQVAIVQAAIFTSDRAAFSQNSVLTYFMREFGAELNGPIISLPIPPDAPPEVPRVVLQSPDGTWKLSASLARLDAVWSASNILSTANELQAVTAHCARFLEGYARESNGSIDRLALVISRVRLFHEPAALLIERFCNEQAQRGPFSRSENFEIHNHKVIQLPGFDRSVNSWVRCKTAQIQRQPGILVEQDLNTREEDRAQSRFGAQQVGMFFECARRESDSILRLYFPEEH